MPDNNNTTTPTPTQAGHARTGKHRTQVATQRPRWAVNVARVLVVVMGWANLQVAVLSTQSGIAALPTLQWGIQTAQAQGISADPNAALAFRPTLGSAGNGVPVVNITAPNGAGASLNRYSNFNVGPQGAILNNSTAGGNALLGPGVAANAALLAAGRTANVIINEVSGSANPSSLQGTLEVFGSPASVIIANPGGITCDGCGVINTPRLTLATGGVLGQDAKGQNLGAIGIGNWANVSGLGFDVQGGQIRILGTGLEGTVGQLDLLGQSLVINAPLRAHYLAGELSSINLSAGNQQIRQAADGAWARNPGAIAATIPPGSALAIDASALGAMTAGQIRVIATDAGLGVNLNGALVAHQQDISVRSAGDTRVGEVSAARNIQIDSAGNLSLNGRASAGNEIQLTSAQNLSISGPAVAKGNVTLNAGGNASIAGELHTGGDLAVTAAQQLSLGAAGSSISVLGNTTLDVGNLRQDGLLQVGKDLNVRASNSVALDGNTLVGNNARFEAGQRFDLNGQLQVNNDLEVRAQDISTAAESELTVGHNATLKGSRSLALGGSTQVGNILSLESPNIDLTGSISAASTAIQGGALSMGTAGQTQHIGGDLGLAMDGPIDIRGGLAVTGNASIASGSDEHIGGPVSAGGNLSLNAGGNLTLDSTASAGGTARLVANQDLIVQGNVDAQTIEASGQNVSLGSLTASQSIDTRAGKNLSINGGTTSGGATSLQAAGNMGITQGVRSGGAAQIVANGDLAVGKDVEAAQLAVTGNNVQLGGKVSSASDATLQARQNLAVAGAVQAAGPLLAQAGGNASFNSNLDSGAELAVFAGGNIDMRGSSTAAKGQVLDAKGDISVAQNLNSGALQVQGRDVRVGGDITTGGDTTVNAQGLTVQGTVASGGQVLATLGGGGLGANRIVSNDDIIVESVGAVSIADASAQRDIRLISSSGGINASTLTAGRDLRADASGDVNTSALSAQRDMGISSSGGSVAVASAAAGGHLSATAAQNLAVAGNATAGGALALGSGGALDVGGNLLSGGALQANGASVNLHGDVYSGGNAQIAASAGALVIAGNTESAGNATLSGQTVSLAGAQTLGSLAITSTQGALTSSASLVANGNLSAQAAGPLQVTGSTASGGDQQLGSGTTVQVSGDITSAGKLSANAASGIQAQNIGAGGNMALSTVAGDIVAANLTARGSLAAKAGGNVQSAGQIVGSSLDVQAQTGSITAGTRIASPGQVSLVAGQNIAAQSLIGGATTGDSTTVQAGGTVNFAEIQAGGSYSGKTGGNHVVGAGGFSSQGAAQIESGGNIVMGGAVNAGGDYSATAAGSIRHDANTLVLGQANLSSGGGQTYGGNLIATGALSAVSGGNIQVAGDLQANQTLALQATNGSVHVGGALGSGSSTSIAAGGDIGIQGTSNFTSGSFTSTGGAIQFGGDVSGSQSLSTHAAGDIGFNGNVTAMGDMDARSTGGSIGFNQGVAVGGNFTGQAANNVSFAGDSQFLGQATITATGGSINNQGSMRGGKDIAIQAGLDFENQGSIEARGNLDVGARNITSNTLAAGGMAAGARMGLTASGVIDVGAQGTLSATGDLALSAAGGMTNAGKLQGGGNLQYTGGTYTNSGQIAADQVNIQANLSNSGSLFGEDISVSGNTGNTGKIGANNTLTLAALNNSGEASGLQVQLGSTTNSGTVTGTNVTVAGDLSNSGSVGAANRLDVNAGTITNSGALQAVDMALTASGDVDNSGQIQASNKLDITAGALVNSLKETGGCLVDSEICNQTPYADGSTPRPYDPLTDERWTQNPGTIFAGAGGLNVSAGSVQNQGVINTTGNATLHLTGALTNTRSVRDLLTEGNAGAANPGTNTGVIAATGKLDITAESATNSGGKLQAGQALTIKTTGDFQSTTQNSQAGPLVSTVSGSTVAITAGNISNQGRVVATDGDLTLTSAGSISNTTANAALVASGASGEFGKITMDAAGAVNNGVGAQILSDEQINIKGASFTNAGTVYGQSAPTKTINIQTTGGIKNTATGILIAGDKLTLEGSTYTNAGMVGSLKDATLKTQSVYTPGQNALIAKGHLDLQTQGVAVGSDQLWVADSTNVTWTGTLTNLGTVDLKGDASGTILNQASGFTTQTGAPPADGSYVASGPSDPATITNPQITSYTDVGQRAYIRVGGNFTGSLTNIASDAAVGGTFTYDPQSIAQTVTYSGTDAGGNPITQTSDGLSLARLVTGPGHTTITLTGPSTGTIVSESLTINGGDLSLGSGVDVSAGNQAILNAQNQTLDPGAAAQAQAGGGAGGNVGGTDTVTATPGGSLTAALQGTTGQATTGPDSAHTGQASGQSGQETGTLRFSMPTLVATLGGDALGGTDPQQNLNLADLGVGTPAGAGVAALLGGNNKAQLTDWNQLKVNPGTISANDLALNLSGTFTTKGVFEIAGDLSIKAAQGIDNSGASLKAGGEIALYGGGLNNKNGTIEADSLWADLDGDLNNDQGRIATTRDAWIMAAGNIHATQGSFTSQEGDFLLSADGNIDLIAAKVSAKQGQASVSAGGNLTISAIKTTTETSTSSSQSSETWSTAVCNSGGDNAGCTESVLTSRTSGSSTSQTRVDSIEASAIEGKDVYLGAGGDMTLTAAQIKAAQDASLSAGGKLTIQGERGQKNSQGVATSNAEQSYNCSGDAGGTCMGGLATTTTTSASQEFLQASSIEAGSKVQIVSGQDMDLRSAQIKGGEGATLQAGGNLSITAEALKTENKSNSQSTQTLFSAYDKGSALGSESSTVHQGSSIDGGKGDLRIVAAGDLSAVGSELKAGGNVALQGRNVRIEAAKDNLATRSEAHSAGSDRANIASDEALSGGIVSAGGNLSISAKGDKAQGQGDITLRGATVTAKDSVTLIANRDVNVEALQTEHSRYDASSERGGGHFLSSKTEVTVAQSHTSASEGSVITGNNIYMQAGQDIKVQGSHVVGQGDVGLAAARDIKILAGTDTASASTHTEKTTKGLFSGGGIGFTIGSRSTVTDHTNESTHASGSSIQSQGGDVNLLAGNRYEQVGSNVLSAGDINIAAKEVSITEAREIERDKFEMRAKQSGLTLSLSSPLVSAVNTAQSTANTIGKTNDTRTQALAGAALGLNLYNNAKDIKGAADAIASGNPQDAFKISISLGGSQSKSTSSYTVDNTAGSTIRADGNVNISATGGDLLVRGSDISAGGNTALSASGNIQLLAAANRFEEHNSNSSSSASIGLSVGTGGFAVTVAASQAKGNGDGEQTTWTNSHISSGGTTSLTSGGNTTIAGGVVSGKTVIADVGGNLNIQSLQDSSNYSGKSSSSGFSVSIPIGPGIPGGSISGGKTTINSEYASVMEQSGIRAGDGGFQVNVKGDTALTGGTITSSQVAIDQGKNSFETGGTLSLSDIQNKADYKGSGFEVTIGVGSEKGNSGAGVGLDKGSASSVTVAAISGVAGKTEARTGDKETGIKPIFDKDQVRDNVDAGIAATKEFGKQATPAAAKFSDDRAIQLRREGKEEEAQLWDEGGANRIALYAGLGALTGGVGGAAGALGSATLVPVIGEGIADLNLPDPIREALTQVVGAAIGAALGGAAGAAAAQTQTALNYVSHSPYGNVRRMVSQENARLMNECGSNCTQADFDRIDSQMKTLEAASNLAQVSKASKLTPEQTLQLGETMAVLLPFYGSPLAAYQAITGKSLSGRDLGAAEQFLAGVAAALPLGSAAYKLYNSAIAEIRWMSSVGGVGADGRALMDFSQLTAPQKGVVGELLGANTVQNALPGSTRIGRMGEVGSQGIDDLYKVASPNVDYVIVEYKFGTSPLGKTADGVQMSDSWVVGSDRILNAVGKNPIEAHAVRQAMDGGRVEKWVVHTDPAGGTSIWIVNSAGKVAKADSSITSRVLGGKK